jgi:hypothetical protein
MARKQWSELGDRTRMLLLSAAAADGILRVAALIDIKRRPADQIRGRKWMWATAVTVISSAGVIPVSYFILGAGNGPCLRRKGGVTHETDHRHRQA